MQIILLMAVLSFLPIFSKKPLEMKNLRSFHSRGSLCKCMKCI